MNLGGIVPVLLFLLTSLSGCSEDNDFSRSYNLVTVGLYSESRVIELTVWDNVTGKNSEVGQYSAVVSRDVGHEVNIGCPNYFQPFYLRVTVKESTGSYYPPPRVLQVGNWTGLECGNYYTFVIDEQDHIHLYKGEQKTPPFRNPMPRVPA